MREFGVRITEKEAGKVSVFVSAREAAQYLGVSPSAVSLALKRGVLCKNVKLEAVRRLYVVKTADMRYVVCIRESSRDPFVSLDGREVLKLRDVASYKEVTKCMWI